MSETKWTPGPWRCHISHPHLGINGKPSNDGIPYEYCITGSNENGGSVLPILGRTHNWPENFKANANLIAAAPELFAALEELLSEWFDEEGTGTQDDPFVAKARAALAKARGEQNAETNAG